MGQAILFAFATLKTAIQTLPNDVDTQRYSGDIQRCPRDIQGYLQYPEIPEKSSDIWR